MRQSGEMFESTNYANHFYGSRKTDVERILAEGRHVVTVMDICGAMALKTHFPNVVTVFVKRDRRDLLNAILEKDLSQADKVSRILALEAELQNAEVCDFVVKYESTAQAVRQICEGLHIGCAQN